MEKVLVVCDDDEERENLRLFLTFIGYKVNVARDGVSAVNLLNSDLIDLLITKATGFKINGNSIGKHVKESGNNQIATIAIGATGDDIDFSLFDSILMRPCKFGHLEGVINSVMLQKRASPG